MRFWKYQGMGNDFVLLEDMDLKAPFDADFAQRACDRHFGIGADGLLYLRPSDVADATMMILNSDGSEAEMCGNGIRCVAKHLYERGIVPRGKMEIETLGGIKRIDCDVVDGKVTAVTVDMGPPEMDCDKVPMRCQGERHAQHINVKGRRLAGVPVSMGNPHFVIFENVPAEDRLVMGPAIEGHEAFPNRVNVEFVRIRDGRLEVEVYERGVGWTKACGTGACAVGAAACVTGRMSFGTPMTVSLPGGDLHICVDVDRSRVMMAGSAELVFIGEYDL